MKLGKGATMALVMAMAYSGIMYDMGSNTPYWELTDEEKEEVKRVYEQRKTERMKKRGLKEFEIDGIKVLALNEKNAIRKINNLKK